MPKTLAMFSTLLSLILTVSACSATNIENPEVEEISIGENDWPWWRGPNRDGITKADQSPPLSWNQTENVLWKIAVPGRGHSSPIVVGDHVFLTTADKKRDVQSVLCYNRDSGKLLWETVVHQGGLATKGNKKASLASSSVACDGKRVFVNFLNGGAVHTTALDRTGKQLWQTKICKYTIHQGYGSSPTVYRDLVLVSADNKAGGTIAALHRGSGNIVWKHSRPRTPNYASPIIVNANDREQLVFTGCNLVSSFDPESGKPLWEIPGSTTECVTSTVTDGDLVFTSGGYPKNHVAAVKADGSGEVVWEKKVRVYVPSMLARDGLLYAVTDAGVAMCWKSNTGKDVWQKRLGGNFTASPVLMGDTLFATNEAGKTFVAQIRKTGLEIVGENQLGDEVYCTPTICGDRIFMRVAQTSDGKRQEMLYCLGKK